MLLMALRIVGIPFLLVSIYIQMVEHELWDMRWKETCLLNRPFCVPTVHFFPSHCPPRQRFQWKYVKRSVTKLSSEIQLPGQAIINGLHPPGSRKEPGVAVRSVTLVAIKFFDKLRACFFVKHKHCSSSLS